MLLPRSIRLTRAVDRRRPRGSGRTADPRGGRQGPNAPRLQLTVRLWYWPMDSGGQPRPPSAARPARAPCSAPPSLLAAGRASGGPSSARQVSAEPRLEPPPRFPSLLLGHAELDLGHRAEGCLGRPSRLHLVSDVLSRREGLPGPDPPIDERLVHRFSHHRPCTVPCARFQDRGAGSCHDRRGRRRTRWRAPAACEATRSGTATGSRYVEGLAPPSGSCWGRDRGPAKPSN